MTSPSVPAGPGPHPPYGPTGLGGPTPPVRPSPHGVGYTAQVPPPSQPTPPPPYGPGPGPAVGPVLSGPGGPAVTHPGGGSAGGPYSAGSAQPQPSAQPSAQTFAQPQPQSMPSAGPGAPGTAGPRVGAAATLLDLGVSRRSDPALVRLVYPLAVAAGVVVWLGPVITMFAMAAVFGGAPLLMVAVLTLVLGWIPALALVGTARLTCETWLRGNGHG